MKKTLLLALFMAIGLASFSEGNEVNVKLGGTVYSSSNKMEDTNGIQINDSKNDGMGGEFTFEYLREVLPNFKVGAGVGYQINPKIEGYNFYDVSRIVTHPISGAMVELEEEKGYESAKYYNSIPVYVTGKYSFPINNDFSVFGKVNLGYSINTAKDDVTYREKAEYDIPNAHDELIYSTSKKYDTKAKNGLYYGVGGGVEYKNFIADLFLQQNMGKLEFDGRKENLNTLKITLGIGYSFKF